MQATYSPKVKICCIASRGEAQLAIEMGAAVLGLVSAMPSGPGPIEEILIADIARHIPPGVASFLLTSRQDAVGIIAQQKRTGVNTIQLVDHVETDTLGELRESLPGIALVQVIHVVGLASLEEAVAVAPYVNAILLDSGNPALAVKELGGTGRRHDWQISRQIREAIDVPLFLAGGLTPENVSEAIATVGPFGLDVCSGVRTNGLLDPDKLSAFFRAVTSAC